jgi:hypothetical protein
VESVLDDSMTVADALAAHLDEQGLPADGGQSDAFALIKLGPIPFAIPNTDGRKRAVHIHDLNHLFAGYGTDLPGEAEISAWELASGGCGPFTAAWALDLAGLLSGLVAFPRRTWRAFQAGRSAQNLYHDDFNEVTALSVAAVRARVSTGSKHRTPAAVHLAGLIVLSVPVIVAFGLMGAITTPWWFVQRRYGRASAGAAT